ELRVDVRDSSGAAMSAATGIARSLESGVNHRFETDAQGAYTLSGLLYGRYRIQVSKQGFATSTVIAIVQSASASQEITLLVGTPEFGVNVVSVTPLPGDDRTSDDVPLPIESATDKDIDASGAINLADFLNRRLTAVYVNDIQGNPFQPDINYR